MAFTGEPTITQISERNVRITGLSLATGASGDIGLFGSTVVDAVELPRAFSPDEYRFEGDIITLIQSIRVTINPVTDVDGGDFVVPIRVVKTGAGLAFAITLTNDEAAVDSPELEINIEFRD